MLFFFRQIGAFLLLVDDLRLQPPKMTVLAFMRANPLPEEASLSFQASLQNARFCRMFSAEHSAPQKSLQNTWLCRSLGSTAFCLQNSQLCGISSVK
jgi:hypothetical protein